MSFFGHLDPSDLGVMGEIPSAVIKHGLKNPVHASVSALSTPLAETDAQSLGYRFIGTPTPSSDFSNEELLQILGQNRYAVAFWRIHHMKLAEEHLSLRQQLAEAQGLGPSSSKKKRRSHRKRRRRPTVDPFLG